MDCLGFLVEGGGRVQLMGCKKEKEEERRERAVNTITRSWGWDGLAYQVPTSPYPSPPFPLDTHT